MKRKMVCIGNKMHRSKGKIFSQLHMQGYICETLNTESSCIFQNVKNPQDEIRFKFGIWPSYEDLRLFSK